MSNDQTCPQEKGIDCVQVYVHIKLYKYVQVYPPHRWLNNQYSTQPFRISCQPFVSPSQFSSNSAHTMACHGRYTTEKVTYPSHGETITGILYMPKGITNPPGVVVLGPYSFVKEQAPLQYGTRLADEGYAALIFDPRTVGESTGVPRRLENPLMKNEDVVSGLDYLASRGDVDAKKLFLVGVCQGGPECLDVASYDDRVIAVASVTGYYRDHETDVYMICAGCVNIEPGVDVGAMKMPTPEQGEALYQARIERARKAKELYDETGEVVYQPLVDPKAADPSVGSLAGLPGPVPWSQTCQQSSQSI